MGKCPTCGRDIGIMSTFIGWDNWGKFICPDCGKQVGFRRWVFLAIFLLVLLIGIERLLNIMLILNFPLWLCFFISFIMPSLVMFIIPMFWKYK